jgi:hypothetical protein
VLTEFVTTLWPGMITPGGPNEVTMQNPFTAFNTQNEIVDLEILARLERSDALGEILSQKDEFVSYFMGLLNASPHSHPNTHRVLQSASQIALFAAMHFKDQYRRQRPAQLCAPLLPPSETPGHASYPSGHATQSRLMANSVGLVLDQALPAATAKIMKDNLQALALRIARNREIAGFHYHSDSTGGQKLADDIFKQLDADLNAAAPQMLRLSDAVTKAIVEWTP